MRLTTSELLEKIRLGEDSSLELKEVGLAGSRVMAPTRDSLADELAAFANSRGGLVVLGVEDGESDIEGIPEPSLDLVETFVRDICNDSIRPPLIAYIEKRLLPNRRGTDSAVIVIAIPRSLFVHESPGGYLHRIGSSKRRLSPDYLARLFQQRSQARIIRFDEQAIPDAKLSDLEEALWRRFMTERSQAESPEVFLRKLGFARIDEDGACRPTVSGVLLASRNPRQFLPNAFIQAVAYRGTNITPDPNGRAYQLDASDISGPIDEQVAGALRFVARNMKIAASKTIGRLDLPQFDLAAVFEALTNAVAHRDYAIHGSKIRLRLFEDRLEIYIPGALANTMTVDSLPHRQSARNEVLTSLLARCPLPEHITGFESVRAAMMDKRGEGVRIIIEATLARAGKPPVYELIGGEELLLTIPAANPE
jgi:predicted HTH transcriptional regulator